MKNFKRIVALFIAVISLASVMAIGVFAANTTDTFSTVTISPSSYTKGESRLKQDSTPVYYKGVVCTDTHTYVQARGSYTATSTSAFYNETVVAGDYVTYVICRKNIDYSISSAINESGYNYATLFFKRLPSYTTSSSTTLEYGWSPDSGNTHTPAT